MQGVFQGLQKIGRRLRETLEGCDPTQCATAPCSHPPADLAKLCSTTEHPLLRSLPTSLLAPTARNNAPFFSLCHPFELSNFVPLLCILPQWPNAPDKQICSSFWPIATPTIQCLPAKPVARLHALVARHRQRSRQPGSYGRGSDEQRARREIAAV